MHPLLIMYGYVAVTVYIIITALIFISQIAPPGTFNDIHFINNQEGWVVGDGGVIGHTTDGGAGWATQTNPDTQNRTLIGVFFLDSNNGWAVGADGSDSPDNGRRNYLGY